ncbi:DUF3187 family protein [Shewanella profunda]|uniref:DUF3187 family protein n=1 Tax=Shewanella profunda TaxID=254793 RepID=UPI00200F1FAE|nr:DUF3187 family protein [Shewanella profunda]MCL1091888.1 DUF3187 family protein [Shewanella profunda]
MSPLSIRLILLLFVVSAPNAFATYTTFSDYGPLRVYAQSPAQTASLTPLLRSGFALANGQKELYISATAASVWAETDDYFADYYHNTLSAGLQWQFSDNWMLDANYQWRFSADNHLDSVTVWFHDALGYSQNGRGDTAKHQNQIFSSDGIHQTEFSGETLNNAFNLYLGYQLFQNASHGLSIGGSLYYNTVDSGPFANNNFEQALQLNYSYRHNRHHFHSTLGISFRQDEEVLTDISYNDYALMYGLSYEYQVERHGLLIEVHHYQGVLETDNDFSKSSNEVLLGYRYYLDNSAVEFTIIENFLNMDNSTDIAFTLGYRAKLE